MKKLVRALDLKLIRDVWRLRGQTIAIALVIGAATATYVLAQSVHSSLSMTRDTYYIEQKFADVFAHMTRAPRSITARVADIPGVKTAEGRISQFATLDLPGRLEPIRAQIVSVEEGGASKLNQIVLRKGRGPHVDATGEVVLDEKFAQANAFDIGDAFDATIYGTRQSLKVVGLALGPDFIWALAPGDLVPDEKRYGILWMGRKALEAATDRAEAINFISLMLDGSRSEADVIRALDTIIEPFGGTGAYGRENQISHAFLKSDLDQLKALAYSIPPIFLLVSTFLVYVVLSRLIRTEREKIGLLKAFGYSANAIAWHYATFAVVIGVLGIAIGLVAGNWMGRGMMNLYLEYYRLPLMQYEMPLVVLGNASALAIGAALIGALGGVQQAARLTPAVAMNPPPPSVYKSGAVESFGRWLGLRSVGEMILRHMARWPLRSSITVFGVALALGLLYATLQFTDGTKAMMDTYFTRAQKQDMMVTLIEPREAAVLRDLEKLPGVMRVESSRTVSARLTFGQRSERTSIEGRDISGQLSALINSDQIEVGLPPNGLALSSIMAGKLGVKAGDILDVELLEGRHTRAQLPVMKVVPEYVGERVYASLETIAGLTLDNAAVNTALLKIDPAKRSDLLKILKDAPQTLGVTESARAREKFQYVIDQNINVSLVFYVIFASAIVVGVVYNSARIIFSERAHELATLRVLGYTRPEVGTILLGELYFLIALALPIGGVLGYYIGLFFVWAFSSDLFRMPFAPSRATLGWAVVITIVASIVTAFFVGRRIYSLDMVRVLKARD